MKIIEQELEEKKSKAVGEKKGKESEVGDGTVKQMEEKEKKMEASGEKRTRGRGVGKLPTG